MNGKLDLHPKVVGSTLAGALTILIVYGLSLGHITVPTVASAALTVVISGIGGWLAPVGYPAQPTTTPEPTKTS